MGFFKLVSYPPHPANAGGVARVGGGKKVGSSRWTFPQKRRGGIRRPPQLSILLGEDKAQPIAHAASSTLMQTLPKG